MAKNNKLTLASVLKQTGVGEYKELPVEFQGAEGKIHVGDVLVKRLSHDERVCALDEWDLEDKSKATYDQIIRAYVFASIYTEQDQQFFKDIKETGIVLPEFINSLYEVSDTVNDFSGKSSILKKKNSGVSSSSMESVEEPLKKPKKRSRPKSLQSGGPTAKNVDHSSLDEG
ncbi:hypothetical protein D9K80_15645 [Acinetobacter cumulans]|uniref:Uncharacterized protein n=1 Tax=Acinetobacter cumulans TaxID=2136182 RepID=A0A498CX27_9GAMM|nr:MULTISPECIES: hypothetical protein [Acinetobacter]MBI1450328.1 hypothetical protein [Acinetobacter sp. FL51]RLL30739.1 hypothetical protein D9K80_15645 [Acinetobacter cumulans]